MHDANMTRTALTISPTWCAIKSGEGPLLHGVNGIPADPLPIEIPFFAASGPKIVPTKLHCIPYGRELMLVSSVNFAVQAQFTMFVHCTVRSVPMAFKSVEFL